MNIFEKEQYLFSLIAKAKSVLEIDKSNENKAFNTSFKLLLEQTDFNISEFDKVYDSFNNNKYAFANYTKKYLQEAKSDVTLNESINLLNKNKIDYNGFIHMLDKKIKEFEKVNEFEKLQCINQIALKTKLLLKKPIYFKGFDINNFEPLLQHICSNNLKVENLYCVYFYAGMNLLIFEFWNIFKHSGSKTINKKYRTYDIATNTFSVLESMDGYHLPVIYKNINFLDTTYTDNLYKDTAKRSIMQKIMSH